MVKASALPWQWGSLRFFIVIYHVIKPMHQPLLNKILLYHLYGNFSEINASE